MESASARPAEAGANSALYATIVNDGGRSGSVSGLRCAGAAMAHLHESYTEDGMARMRAVDSLVVPAGGRVVLAPGGMHVMVMGTTRPLAAGDSLICTFTLGSGDSLAVTAAIRAP